MSDLVRLLNKAKKVFQAKMPLLHIFLQKLKAFIKYMQKMKFVGESFLLSLFFLLK